MDLPGGGVIKKAPGAIPDADRENLAQARGIVIAGA
jgi:hypothetical protein